MENDVQPEKPRKAGAIKTAALVIGVLAVGAVMSLTGRNGPNRCGCLPPRLTRPQLSTEAAQQQGTAKADCPCCAERIVAYYFHRKERPATCVSVESNTREAIAIGFPEQLKDGRLEWCSVNYEEPGNEHYATDYKFAAPCLVLVRMKCGKAVEWRSLPEVWELAGAKSALVQLVQRNVQEFLDYIAIPGACCT